ncbi:MULTISPECIES: carboxylate--amine ligase [Thalassospira]|uniref:carboxylate--amine ligase n=1 Tax=Thalassospira TaxID=168934 RepID=UPI0008DC7DAA|nr:MULTISPECIES: carboxylate--amine ligase [Thalassospira]MAB34807.1 carboxylate--amine ligase [Thalassospira sp.]MDM7976567.1 carboxylate--amine ligase [Thalassospira xiamenensis]OHY97373.1 carboxylate--amine ligase [Thalassospira sp. MIT1004]HBS25174.1 carboxylate--amine ligase [Thalassospira sp.]|tara:strand:+ start:457 stop:1530 length:1074 start_codon:yes stop_codon:yes gene_type:complete
MKKIIITGAGSAQANGVINCLRMANSGEQIIGFGSDPIDLVMCDADVRYLIPHSQHPDYKTKFLATLAALKPDMIHFQHDLELWTALKFRDEIEATGVRMLVPDFETIDTCVHKFKSWEKFKSHGLVVPENILINTPQDLKVALENLGDEEGTIWLRSTEIGGGGKGAFPTNDLNEAIEWIERYDGWGHFSAAELLTSQTVTWLSIWKDGDLVVSQSRRRKGWAHSSLSPSGVTGVTKIGETCSDPEVEEIGKNAVRAVSKTPNGIYGVDMTYDKNGVPNPTEINISRFFTTIQFFAEAGLNMPAILKDIVLYNRLPPKEAKMRNPLPDGLLWLRAMDRAPLLTTAAEIRALLNEAP